MNRLPRAECTNCGRSIAIRFMPRHLSRCTRLSPIANPNHRQRYPRDECPNCGRMIARRQMTRHQNGPQCIREESDEEQLEEGPNEEQHASDESDEEEPAQEQRHSPVDTLLSADRIIRAAEGMENLYTQMQNNAQTIRSNVESMAAEFETAQTRVQHIWDTAERVDREYETIETLSTDVVRQLREVLSGVDAIAEQAINRIIQNVSTQLEQVVSTVADEAIARIRMISATSPAHSPTRPYTPPPTRQGLAIQSVQQYNASPVSQHSGSPQPRIIDLTVNPIPPLLRSPLQRVSQQSPVSSPTVGENDCIICFLRMTPPERRNCPANTPHCTGRYHYHCLLTALNNISECPNCREPITRDN